MYFPIVFRENENYCKYDKVFESILEELRDLRVSYILSRDKGLYESFMDRERYFGVENIVVVLQKYF